MSILENIQATGSTALFATEVMSLLGLNPYDLEDPSRFEKFKSVISYLKTQENYRYIIKKIALNKNVDPLDTVYDFVKLNEDMDLVEKEYKEVSEQIDTLVKFSSEKGVEPEELADYKTLSDKRDSIISKLQALNDEAKLY